MNVFSGDVKLYNVKIDNDNEVYKYESGILLKKDGTEILFVSDSILKNSSTFTIPNGIESFSVDLSNYDNIKKILIPSSVISLGNGSKYPSAIEEIEIEEGNTTYCVENDALYTKDKKKLIYCYSKGTEIILNAGVQIISEFAFFGATEMTNINLPDSVIQIRYTSFYK